MASNIINRLKSYKVEVTVLSLGLVHQLFQKILGFRLGWIDSYADDLMAVPFISACVLLMENFLIYKSHNRKHSFTQLLFLFIFISVFFEIIAPKISSSYTKDYIDVYFYFIGFIAYYLAIKKAN